MRVLLGLEDPDIRHRIVQLLQAEAHEVTWATDSR